MIPTAISIRPARVSDTSSVQLHCIPAEDSRTPRPNQRWKLFEEVRHSVRKAGQRPFGASVLKATARASGSVKQLKSTFF